MHLPRDATTLLHRAFGGPFGGGCGVGFFPPFGVECTTTTTTSSTTSPEKTTTKTQKAPTATKTTVIVSPTIVTSVVVVTSGNTITAGTTFTSGTTVTSVITPAPPATPASTDTSSPTSSDASTIGDSSSVLSSPPVSSNATQPTAIPNQTITDTKTLVLSNSPPSSSVLTQPTSSSTTSSTSIPTFVPTQSATQSSRGMSTGEIAAICIACVALVALSVLIWIARRKRTARRSEAAASDPADPGDEENVPTSNVAEPSIRAAAASPAPDSHRMSPDVPEHMEEKRDTISRYSGSGETASSPGSSTALSSFPLLSPGPLTPTDAEPAFSQMRSFRLAWDDPPPTPDRRPVSLQSGQGAAYRRSQGGDGYLAATTMENYDRNSVYAAYLSREGGRSEVTLGQPPEYSRY